jgi:hypothetical protein
MHIFDHFVSTFVETFTYKSYKPSLRVPSKLIMSGLALCAMIFGASYTASLTTVLEKQRESRLRAVVTSYEDAERNDVFLCTGYWWITVGHEAKLKTFYPGIRFIYFTSVGNMKAERDTRSAGCTRRVENRTFDGGRQEDVEVGCTGIELLESGACAGLLYDEPLVEYIDSSRCEFQFLSKTVLRSLGYGSAFNTGSPYHVLEPAVSYMLNFYRSEVKFVQRIFNTHLHPGANCEGFDQSDSDTSFGSEEMLGVVVLQFLICAFATVVWLVSLAVQQGSEKRRRAKELAATPRGFEQSESNRVAHSTISTARSNTEVTL